MNNGTDILNMIEKALGRCLPRGDGETAFIPEMLSYSLESGGKRVRPVLCLEFCHACGGDPEKALSFACAVEYIHTYSLIHDDLPCMDNDDYRRGRPSSHKKFGEANALLAGDALLTHAFGIISGGCLAGETTPEQAIKAVDELSRYAGINGMIGGQYIDLKYENTDTDKSVIFTMDELKTAALIRAACVLGVIAADGGEDELCAARDFGLNLGIAFQIKDDLIEYDEGDTSDAENGKSTYITLLGYEGALREAEKYTARAISSLDVFGERADEIRSIAGKLLNRKR